MSEQESNTTENQAPIEETSSDPKPQGLVAEAIASATKEYNEKQAKETPKGDSAIEPAEKAPKKAKKIEPPIPEPDTIEAVQRDIEDQGAIDPTDIDEPETPISDLPPIEPPQFWEAKDKEAFKKLPYDAQRMMVKYETQARTWASQIAQQAAEARKAQKEFDRITTPHKDLLKSYNTDPFVAFDNALTNAALMERDPIMMISRYMRQYGLTPQDLMNGYGPQPGYQNGYGQTDYYQPHYEEYTDPRIDEALEKANRLEQMLQGQSESATQQQQQLLAAEIESFASETDDNGNLLHPHFNDFRHKIGEEVSRLEQEGVYKHPRDLMKAAYRTVVNQLEDKFIKPRLANGQFASRSEVEALKSKKAEAAAGSLSGSTLGNSAQRKKYRTASGEIDVAQMIADSAREVRGA